MANVSDKSILTAAGKALLAQLNAEEKALVIDKMIFANVPNRPEYPQPDDVVPTDNVVHQAAVEQRGRLSEDSVIYSTTLASNEGPFEFNWTGAYCSEYGVLVTIDHHSLTPKTVDEPGVSGNTLVRSVVLEYKDIAEITNITVDASTWQYNANPRMKKMDDDVAQANIDQNGKDWFVEGGFLVTPQDSAFSIKAGAGYVSGNRVALEFDRSIQVPNKPSFIYIDAHREGTPTGEQVTLFNFVVSAEEKDDYIDSSTGKDVPHFVCKIAQVLGDGSVSDLRLLSSVENLVSVITESLEWAPKIYVNKYSRYKVNGDYYVPKVLGFYTKDSFKDDYALGLWVHSSLAPGLNNKTYENVYEMKKSHLESGELVRVKGHFIAFDGGGAEYLIKDECEYNDDVFFILLDNGKYAELNHKGKINTKQLGCVGNNINDDLVGLNALNKYIESLPEYSQTGTGNDCSSIDIECVGFLYVSNTWAPKRTRSLNIDRLKVAPLEGFFVRGAWLVDFTTKEDSSPYSHEDLTLTNPVFRGEWEANLLLLSDFLRVSLINPKFERWYQFGLKTRKVYNTPHELSWFNASFFQRFYHDEYPEHLPENCHPFVIDSPDNDLVTTIVGYCKDNIGSVGLNGSATVFNGYHFYEGNFNLDGTHVYFNCGYWDGSYLSPTTTTWQINNSFIQATVPKFEFVRGVIILGNTQIKGCSFRYRPSENDEHVENYGSIFDASIHGVNIYETIVKDNSFDRWHRVIIGNDSVQELVIRPDDWIVLNDYWFFEIPFPRYKGNRAPSYVMSEIDYTKYCVFFDNGTNFRIRCYYVTGVGTAKPDGIVTVYADNTVKPTFSS